MFILLSQEIDADDEKALEMFMSKKPETRLTLADMIMEKITEKQTEIQTQFTDAESECKIYLLTITLQKQNFEHFWAIKTTFFIVW